MVVALNVRAPPHTGWQTSASPTELTFRGSDPRSALDRGRRGFCHQAAARPQEDRHQDGSNPATNGTAARKVRRSRRHPHRTLPPGTDPSQALIIRPKIAGNQARGMRQQRPSSGIPAIGPPTLEFMDPLALTDHIVANHQLPDRRSLADANGPRCEMTRAPENQKHGGRGNAIPPQKRHGQRSAPKLSTSSRRSQHGRGICAC